jgi:hypothetical protein
VYKRDDEEIIIVPLDILILIIKLDSRERFKRHTCGESIMFIQLPKVQKSTGKLVDTVVDANAILGMDSATFNYGGKSVQGTKVYVAGGNFRVLASPLMIIEAKHMALLTGKPQIVHAIGSPMLKKISAKVLVEAKQNQKLIGIGKGSIDHTT